jgi:hypothetical protein
MLPKVHRIRVGGCVLARRNSLRAALPRIQSPTPTGLPLRGAGSGADKKRGDRLINGNACFDQCASAM